MDPSTPYYPWPDRETCILDILRHVPRCAFSRKQNTAIHWAMAALGVQSLPSDRTLDDIDKALQKICGIQSFRYEGKLGHVYYVNDFSAIIAQEFSNPSVRSQLHFLPEDSGKLLGEAYQAKRWLHEQDPNLLTPVHIDPTSKEHFYIFEPALLRNGCICMPFRWFKRAGKTLAKAWLMESMKFREHGSGWAVQTCSEIEIDSSNLLFSFPRLRTIYSTLKIEDPSRIMAEQTSTDDFISWKRTDPLVGNEWRTKSQGKRVVAFPIWLYCDDTSGNLSKKWNKHNSFLFTAAGLSCHVSSQESNIHFLCTSNTAPPLEMLDGIVEQLEKAQTEGIWAWDSKYNDLVLVIPSVLALLGDNPMQSELACHIGFLGRLFCRNCWVSGKPESQEGSDGADGHGSDVSVTSTNSKQGRNRKAGESMKDMITRIRDFMTPGKPRNVNETQEMLRAQFTQGSWIGGGAQFARMKTESGIKDNYQAVFIERLQSIATKKGIPKTQKEWEMTELQKSFPQHTTSPVLRIKGLDPHQDTPVEVLHVVLLGMVKYLWRDSVARTKKDHNVLIARLSSFNTWGLGLSPLSGKTLVTYAGSLTGRDFRVVAQAAPFVLQGLINVEQMKVWKALSTLVTLIWQPQIQDIDEYLNELQNSIDHFLDCTCQLTPRWFNKPKFHILLHLPEHIRRFGPAMLFATESFESYNAIIRTRSVHSNRHAPSKDIANAMARSNRVRHLLNGGLFWVPSDRVSDIGSLLMPDTIYQRMSKAPLRYANPPNWKSASSEVYALIKILDFDKKLLKIHEDNHNRPSAEFSCLPTGVALQSGDQGLEGSWVLWNRSAGQSNFPTIGRIVEAVQLDGSNLEKVDFVTLQRAITGEWHSAYGMRRIQLTDEIVRADPKVDILCVVNLQHNCVDNQCPTNKTGAVMKEREISKEKELKVEHNNASDLILNTAQMRSAAYLMPFRHPITHSDRESVIVQSVRAEIDVRRRQRAREGSTATEPSSSTRPPMRVQTPSSLWQQSQIQSSLPTRSPQILPLHPLSPTTLTCQSISFAHPQLGSNPSLPTHISHLSSLSYTPPHQLSPYPSSLTHTTHMVPPLLLNHQQLHNTQIHPFPHQPLETHPSHHQNESSNRSLQHLSRSSFSGDHQLFLSSQSHPFTGPG
ncbi:hypothetical protein DFH05DRAFT_1406273 [Lentinula detonsa]|uniref:Uncharacterized protein n=1 Tax=Lentinula detonsa TaxID=2804962 RepID=A0A9W8NSS6_9AGAR|nr:hypothetical protein DFH05DRAFT_1406273 [Lentinula detonsa]